MNRFLTLLHKEIHRANAEWQMDLASGRTDDHRHLATPNKLLYATNS